MGLWNHRRGGHGFTSHTRNPKKGSVPRTSPSHPILTCLPSFTIYFSRASRTPPPGSFPKRISTQRTTEKPDSAFIRVTGPCSSGPSSAISSRWRDQRVLRLLPGAYLEAESSVLMPKRPAARRVARRDAQPSTPIGSARPRKRKCVMPSRRSQRKSVRRVSRHVCHSLRLPRAFFFGG